MDQTQRQKGKLRGCLVSPHAAAGVHSRIRLFPRGRDRGSRIQGDAQGSPKQGGRVPSSYRHVICARSVTVFCECSCLTPRSLADQRRRNTKRPRQKRLGALPVSVSELLSCIVSDIWRDHVGWQQPSQGGPVGRAQERYGSNSTATVFNPSASPPQK